MILRKEMILIGCVSLLLVAFGSVYVSAQVLNECSKIEGSEEMRDCFKDANSQIRKERIQAYANESNAVKRWFLAIKYMNDFLVSPLSTDLAVLEEHTGASSGLNDFERSVAKQMFSDLKRIYDLGRQFESSLSHEEILTITRSNPDSVYPKVGRILVYFGSQQSECGKAELAALRRELPDMENARGMVLSVLSHLHISEDLHRRAYAEEVVKLLQKEPSYKRFLPELPQFYKAVESFFYSSMSRTGIPLTIEKSKLRLLSLGLAEPGRLEEKLLSLAKRHPACFTASPYQLVMLF